MANKPIEVPIMANLAKKGELPEYLFWVGCAGSYDQRYMKVTRAFAKILTHLNISYAILGNEESCTGDPAKRAGNEMLFQSQALQNIEIMNGYKVQKIFTACPHCFNTIRNEYPELGGKYEVVHHTQFLTSLLNEGKLTIDPKYYENTRITFHDPCYLGRGNNEYDAPRLLLNELSENMVELRRSKQNSFCCGAGGAQMFKEQEQGHKDINKVRTDELLKEDPEVIATACPFCMLMLNDGVKNNDTKKEVDILDLAELIVKANGW